MQCFTGATYDHMQGEINYLSTVGITAAESGTE